MLANINSQPLMKQVSAGETSNVQKSPKQLPRMMHHKCEMQYLTSRVVTSVIIIYILIGLYLPTCVTLFVSHFSDIV